MIQPLVLRIESVSGETVTAAAPDGQRWEIPLESIHGTPNVGQTLKVVGVVPDAAEAHTSALAQALLNELLTPSST